MRSRKRIEHQQGQANTLSLIEQRAIQRCSRRRYRVRAMLPELARCARWLEEKKCGPWRRGGVVGKLEIKLFRGRSIPDHSDTPGRCDGRRCLQ